MSDESDFVISDDASDFEPEASIKVTKPKKDATSILKSKITKVAKLSKVNGNGQDESAPSTPLSASKNGGKTVEQIYQKKSQLEHILLRPDTYIGSVEKEEMELWVFDEESKLFTLKKIEIVPGLYKIFDEILVNAADNKMRDSDMSKLKVEINQETNTISIYNNGKGIPIQIHKEENIYIPELIFGHLLTSSNYNDDDKKVVGGRNGYGAKLCNIFSSEFIVETGDREVGKKYYQKFSNNMSKIEKPKITNFSKGEEFTKITFKPDLDKFKMTHLDDNVVALMKKRVYDMCGTVKNIKVFLNEEKLPVKNFKDYCNMYLKSVGSAEEKNDDGKKLLFETVGDRWEIGFVCNESSSLKHVSFVNSICTSKGGTHVNHVVDKLVARIGDTFKRKNPELKDKLRTSAIKNNMWVFINCLIENPSFGSQTKENLTLKQSAFGSKCDMKKGFLDLIEKSGILKNLIDEAKTKQSREVTNSVSVNSGKRSRITGLKNFFDANWAGTSKSSQCTLILTEGVSAYSMALSGLAEVSRNQFGAFSLRGKILNVRDASAKQIMENEELKAICKILGLNAKKNYTSIKELRYGHLMIMTDQDPDGSHIKGLLINYIDHFYPSLLKIQGFLQEFITPIVKAFKGNQTVSFYTIPEYQEWKESDESKGFKIKYYKGLATSDANDAKAYFKDIKNHRKVFNKMEDEERNFIDLAFSKKRADNRKDWLRGFRPGTFLDQSGETISYDDFINKELIQFSMADNLRSIPSVIDGFKPGQRKILFGCFKRNLTEEIKVAQLIGYISEKTAYHHGEFSLGSTIVGMAQDFIGSNNINLLAPLGTFGSRALGGKDAGQTRYIHTNIMPITRIIFNKNDFPLLNYLNDDGYYVEPEYYIPIIPMVLCNGAEGIGTGWSTSIPNYNPTDIVRNLRHLMKGEDMEPMVPWYRGYTGTIQFSTQDRYTVAGKIRKVDETTLEITELPIKVWTQNYKSQLEAWQISITNTKGFISDFFEYSTNSTINIQIKLTEENMLKAEAVGLLEKFKLTNSIATSNMMCFDPEGRILKYVSPNQIINEFYTVRLEFYHKRKAHMLDVLEKDYTRISFQVKFLIEVISGTIVIQNKKKKFIVENLKTKGYPPVFPKVVAAKNDGVIGEAGQSDEEDKSASSNGYNYLLNMPLWNLTYEKVEKYKREMIIKQTEMDTLSKRTPLDLWNEDLDEFLEAWDKISESDRQKHELETQGIKIDPLKKPKTIRKAPVKKIKPAIVPSDEEMEEQVAPKPKSRVPKKSTGTISNSNTIDSYLTKEEDKPKSTVAKRNFIEISDSDDDALKPLSQRMLTLKGRQTLSRKADSVKSDSLVEEDNTKAAAKSITKLVTKRSAKKSKIAISSEDDDDVMEDVNSSPSPPPQPRARPARSAALKKVTYKLEISDDEEKEEEIISEELSE